MTDSMVTYELLKANNNWTIGTNNSVINILSRDASFTNLNIKNGNLNNNKLLSQILLEDNSNNRLLNLSQINQLIKLNNESDITNIELLQKLINDLSNNLISDINDLSVIGDSTLASVNASSLTITGSTNMTTLVASDVSFSNLDVSVNLNVNNDLIVTQTTTLNDANVTSLSVTGSTDLNSLICDDASFANVDISVNLRVDGDLRMHNGNNYVGFNAHTNTSQNQIWNLPTNDGTDGQVIKTDGAGNLSWDNLVSGPAGSNEQLQFNNNGTLTGTSGLTYTPNGQLLLSNSTTSGNPLLKILQSGDGNAFEVHDQTSDNDIFFINTQGGVGINTNSSTDIGLNKLYITGDVYSSTNLVVNNYLKINNNYIDLPQKSLPTPTLIFNASQTTGFGQGSDNTVSIITNNTERFRFGANGELLIEGNSAGTENQVLTSNGATDHPEWKNVNTLLTNQDVSLSNVDISGSLKISANEIDFTNLPTSQQTVSGRLYNDNGFLKISP